MKCNASRNSEGNTKKTLKCDDECARLERNRKLAVALNIDPSTHTDDHVPYSKTTLDLFAEVGTKWAQEQEREFRVFAADDEEKRLRFKPMPTRQRAFVHALAEDFGLDSESMDPEPHRHVAVFKTPRFVSAPAKTLRDCVRIRQTQQRTAAAEALEAQATKKAALVSDPSNGFLLVNPRFALTLDELHAEIRAVQGPQSKLGFNVQFLASGDVALKALPTATAAGTTPLQAERAVEVLLKELHLPLARGFTSHGYGTLQLCRLDDSLNVLQIDTSGTDAAGGWSQVAAKAAAPRRAPQVAPMGSKSGFAVLGSLTARKKKEEGEVKKKKQKEREVVVDDWAAEMDREEGVGEVVAERGMRDGVAVDATAVVEPAEAVAEVSVDEGTVVDMQLSEAKQEESGKEEVAEA